MKLKFFDFGAIDAKWNEKVYQTTSVFFEKCYILCFILYVGAFYSCARQFPTVNKTCVHVEFSVSHFYVDSNTAKCCKKKFCIIKVWIFTKNKGFTI